MTTKARCKFHVTAVKRMHSAEEITLAAHYDPSLPEDIAFAEATPWGEFTFHLSNPNLIGKFNPGEHYYVDLVPVEQPDQA